MTRKSESKWVLVGLCAITASLLLVEVTLTKFVSYKVHYHFVYAIVSTVILSSGFAGVLFHLSSQKLARMESPWTVAAKAAAIYALLLMSSILLFAWMSIDPYSALSDDPLVEMHFPFLPLAIYFCLFALPCIFAGWCISQTLAMSSRSVMTIYCLDLLSAAVGAALSPVLLEAFGGYYTILTAAALGMLAYFAYQRASGARFGKAFAVCAISGFMLLSALFYVYPQWAIKTYGQDIRTLKNAVLQPAVRELGGISLTYWNAVARIDVTKTARTRHFDSIFDLPNLPLLEWRLILVDGYAPTRQLRVTGPVDEEPHIPAFIYASPYIAIGSMENKKALLIGPGGGIDILTAKRFNTKEVEAVELNPSTYKHVLLGLGDPQRDLYQPSLASDADTKVTIYNSEARHFVTTRPAQSYDIIQASGVDTLTAITSGALSLVEGYLYTVEAVRDYVKLLKPNGILSLTHWRLNPPSTSLRMFLTYLEHLESEGIKEPWRCVVVTANTWWTDSMLKATPFTKDELARTREWAAKNGHTLLFDPERKSTAVPPGEESYSQLGFLPRAERIEAIKKYQLDVSPVHDNKPYFYRLIPILDSTPVSLLGLALLGSLILFLIPMASLKRAQLSGRTLMLACFIALSGFAFLLLEATIIQLFSILVGGPIYSLAVVLVAVLSGYALGSLLSERIEPNRLNFTLLGISLSVLFVALFLVLPGAIHSMLPWSIWERIIACAAITFVVSVPVGIPVALRMSVVRKTHGSLVTWLWAISSAGNAIGAMAFGVLTQQTGISETLLLVSVLYLIANVGFAMTLFKKATPETAFDASIGDFQ